MKSADYDIVIVGSGAGGGIAAGVLAEAGKRVLLLERGSALAFAQTGRDHLRNQRLSLYGNNAGPDGDDGQPRVWEDAQGRQHLARPHEGGYDNNAACGGGGTRVYGAQAWRFLPQDFRMASEYGVPEGSSLADWPLTYDDLEPYYERAEWEIGVAGDGAGNRFQGPRRREYPMLPVPDNPARRVLGRGAAQLGWNTFPVPLAINTVPYAGRAACIQCAYCVGFGCPTDAKNGSQNTLIPRALATGSCVLQTGAMAERIDTNEQGAVVGVTYLQDDGAGRVERHTARARAVVVSGGAVESARLLLNSHSRLHPTGLGNARDQVGRHYDGHFYVSAHGLFDDPVQDGIGPGVSIATCQFNHGNPGLVGGGMLANDFFKLPVMFWRASLPPDLARWGRENKQWMRDNFARVLQVAGPVQDIPTPDARVTVAPDVCDRYGIPVARLSGMQHPETFRVAEFLRERAEEWLRASGARQVWSGAVRQARCGGQHQAGTCRMGTDPRVSVTDPFGRVHGHDNLFVVDGSLHVTNGGLNPVLTIMALAFRCAEHIAATL